MLANLMGMRNTRFFSSLPFTFREFPYHQPSSYGFLAGKEFAPGFSSWQL
jgi:hypothetical protein